MSFTCLFLVSRIVAAFNVQPPVYLVHEHDRTVVFPSENSGKFNALIAGSTYEVQGNSGQTQGYSPSPLPFGAYPTIPPPYSPLSRVPSVPVHATKLQRRVIRKTIQVASLASRDPEKPCSSKSGRMAHTVVTQVIVTLDPGNGECNVSTVTEKVQKQLGFPVILLDSKLFPVTEGESTSGTEFWKSTRKIIAVSCSAYEKAGGVLPDKDLIDIDGDETEPQPKRAKTQESVSNSAIVKKLDELDRKLSFITELQRTFECVICRSPVRNPLVASCCQRIIGCKECVRRWLVSNSRCPLCSVSGRMGEALELKGIDDLVAMFRPVHTEPCASSPDRADEENIAIESDSADDFELPSVNLHRRAN